jgi:hypothetical protein
LRPPDEGTHKEKDGGKNMKKGGEGEGASGKSVRKPGLVFSAFGFFRKGKKPNLVSFF